MNLPFSQVWLADFEFISMPGEQPVPVCLVAHEVRSGTTVRLWQDELRRRRLPPYATGPDTLFVAYLASAELGCHLALGWPLPERVLDLYAEFRVATNGKVVNSGNGLLGALSHHGLPCMDVAEKEAMRQLILRGGQWSESECREILDYCESDVKALAALLAAMEPGFDLPRALLRGRYMRAVARMEHVGVPIDRPTHLRLVGGWSQIKGRLIHEVDRHYGVYDGSTFKRDRFAKWLGSNSIPWPRLPSGDLALDDDTFRQMAKAYPIVAPLRELRGALSQMRLNDLAVGQDGRNRVLISPFGSKSGRNTPSNTRSIFGPSVWLRNLIQPPPRRAVAYVDWSQQEFGIAAALSGDGNMLAAYASGDPYMGFAKQAGAVPPDATKTTHGPLRELYKTCALGVQFGMGAQSLSERTGGGLLAARDLLGDHKQSFPRFWQWSDSAADEFTLNGRLWAVFGWQLYSEKGDGERTARNFPMQANGAEMMRLAASYMTERAVQVCAPVHDAFLIEADAGEIAATVEIAQECMAQASRDVLGGFELRTDVANYTHPHRYSDPRGVVMWDAVMRLLDEVQGSKPAPVRQSTCAGVHSERAAAHECISYL